MEYGSGRRRLRSTGRPDPRVAAGNWNGHAPIRLEGPDYGSRRTAAVRPQETTSRTSAGRRRGRRLSKGLSSLALLVGTLAAVLGWATHSRLFAIRTLLVTGSTVASPQTILSRAGIHRGDNLLALSARVVRKRLRSIPSIRDVEVMRRLPHTVILRVEEDPAWAVLEAGSRRLLLDRHDRVIGQTAVPPSGLPRVTISAPGRGEIPAPGQWVINRAEVAALRCIGLGQQKESGFPVSNIFIDSQRDLWLNISGFGKVLLGPPTGLGPKLAALKLIVRSTRAAGLHVRYLDLQEPKAPAYVPLPEETAGETAPGRRR